jgi:cytochrome c oxidase assembly factor CtaG
MIGSTQRVVGIAVIFTGVTVSPSRADIVLVSNGAPEVAWNGSPTQCAALFVMLAMFFAGRSALRKAASSAGKLRRETRWFVAGWLALALAVVSPIHVWGQVKFSIHMVQHELLMVVAAPLLVLGRPWLAWLWVFPRDWTNAPHRWAGAIRLLVSAIGGHPVAAFIVHTIALWVWHVPVMFESALRSDVAHVAQHSCFLLTGLWFWQAVFFGPRREASYGLSVLLLFATALQSGVLGALLTFSRELWYPIYALRTARVGGDPLMDQQLGGLIMWIPASVTYLLAALVIFSRWLTRSRPHFPSAAQFSRREVLLKTVR